MLAGLAAGWIVITCVELLNAFVLFPLPPGTDVTNPESLKAAMKDMPAGALLVVVVGWLLEIGRRAGRHALIVGGIFFVLTFLNLRSMPHPVWMWVAALVLLLPAAMLGGRLAVSERAPGT